MSAVIITAARHEGTIRVREGRQLGIAEFGPPDGRAVVWFHGTPGARRQIPEEARLIAAAKGVRIVGIDRPGIGLSTAHLYDALADFVPDVEIVADRLGVDTFAVVGLSGGGPYALAAAWALGGRVTSVGVLGGVVPTRGPDAAEGGLLGVATKLAPILPIVREPLGLALTTFVRLAKPFGRQLVRLYARASPAGDRALLERPEFGTMFFDDLSTGGSRSMRAFIYDAILFTRDWGFSPRDVEQPIVWWHGDADHIVPLAHAQKLVPQLQRAELRLLHGESHLGGLGIAHEVLQTVLSPP